MLRFFILIILLFGMYLENFGQRLLVINQYKYEANSKIGIVGGLSGFYKPELEFGIGYNHVETRPKNKTFTKPFMGFSLSANVYPTNSDLIGENLNVWVNGLVLFGINQNYYRNDSSNTWGLKPFVGMEIYGVMLSYGYNFFLTENKIEELTHNVFSIRYFLPIFNLTKTKEKDNKNND